MKWNLKKTDNTKTGIKVRYVLEIEEEGLFAIIEQGKFGGVKRSRSGGKGLDGVVKKDEKYQNPFISLMHNK